ncbi:hypothetical protein [Actinacidiphila sp. ITFR-21]|uniref:hypothetical protein n=1 Tax=Actinacidiphila sp. ITFR-21 TaxID=3075199 RepID=UPI0028893C0A|nr:hypothetical protein [Streptomyces sp. ITFR-21]WNI17647.1 hypothetical protein RLT57_20370 [Streptomyces sp. ITFR-21]WNI17787.1 hypothetical protein RLT57_21085 [Streptomyces sp. ITFR-21]
MAGSELAGLSVRLDVRGRLLEPVDGVEIADFKVYLDTASFTDLTQQVRALQYSLIQKARRRAEEDSSLVAEGTAALQEMASPDAAPPTEALLERVVGGLRTWAPAARPTRDSSTASGGP